MLWRCRGTQRHNFSFRNTFHSSLLLLNLTATCSTSRNRSICHRAVCSSVTVFLYTLTNSVLYPIMPLEQILLTYLPLSISSSSFYPPPFSRAQEVSHFPTELRICRVEVLSSLGPQRRQQNWQLASIFRHTLPRRTVSISVYRTS